MTVFFMCGHSVTIDDEVMGETPHGDRDLIASVAAARMCEACEARQLERSR